MGAFRFLLACLVAYSHFPNRSMPINFGISAVIAFYFISGYLMSLSYAQFKQNSAMPIRDFYRDRFFRIVPAFWLVYAVSLFWMVLTNDNSHLRYNTWQYEWLLLPQTFSFFGVRQWSEMISPSWSLGVELEFYLLLPFLLLLKHRWCYVFVVLFVLAHLSAMNFGQSFARYFVQCWGHFQQTCGVQISDLLGYRFIFFGGTSFFVGHLAYLARENAKAKVIYRLCLGLYLTGYFVWLTDDVLTNQRVHEILIAYLLLIPTAKLWLDQIEQLKPDRLDIWLGKLSYPVFLVHFLAMMMVNNWLQPQPFSKIAYWSLTLLLAIGVALFQQRIDRWRYQIRGFSRVTAPK